MPQLLDRVYSVKYDHVPFDEFPYKPILPFPFTTGAIQDSLLFLNSALASSRQLGEASWQTRE
jgi:hypothetical protein